MAFNHNAYDLSDRAHNYGLTAIRAASDNLWKLNPINTDNSQCSDQFSTALQSSDSVFYDIDSSHYISSPVNHATETSQNSFESGTTCWTGSSNGILPVSTHAVYNPSNSTQSDTNSALCSSSKSFSSSITGDLQCPSNSILCDTSSSHLPSPSSHDKINLAFVDDLGLSFTMTVKLSEISENDNSISRDGTRQRFQDKQHTYETAAFTRSGGRIYANSNENESREGNNESNSNSDTIFTVSGGTYLKEKEAQGCVVRSSDQNFSPKRQCRSDTHHNISGSMKTTSISGGREKRPGEEFVAPDGGWGWVVCLTSLWVNGWVMGTVSSFGILYDFIVKQNHDDSAASFKASFVGSCLLAVMLLMCCVSGKLCDVIGLRHTAFLGGLCCVLGFFSSAYVTRLELLYVTYGVILGSGFGLIYSPLFAISAHYFSRRLGLVNGIVTFGPSAFTMALSSALPTLLPLLGFRYTLLAFAGVGVTIAMATLAWKPLVEGSASPVAERNKPKDCLRYAASKVCDPSLWDNRRFMLWSAAIAVSRFGYLEPNFHLVNHVGSILPGQNAAILITILAGTSGVSKLIFGLLSDCVRNYRIFLQLTALLVYGASVLVLPAVSHYSGFVMMAVILGLADALIMVLFGPNVVDLVGPAKASHAFGFLSLLSIPGFLSAPAITGRLHDELGQYNTGFYLTGSVLLLSSGLMTIVRRAPPSHSFTLQQCGATSSETAFPAAIKTKGATATTLAAAVSADGPWKGSNTMDGNGDLDMIMSTSMIQGKRGLKTQGDHRLKTQGEHGLRTQGENGLKTQGEHGLRTQGEYGLKTKGEHRLKTQGEYGLNTQGEHGTIAKEELGFKMHGEYGIVYKGEHGLKTQGEHASTIEGEHELKTQEEHGLTNEGEHELKTKGEHGLKTQGEHDVRMEAEQGRRAEKADWSVLQSPGGEFQCTSL